MSRFISFVFGACFLASFGCGTSGDDPKILPVRGGVEKTTEYCDDAEARAVMCKSANGSDVATCKASASCAADIFREDALIELTGCLSARACGEDDNECFVKTNASITPSA